MIEIPLTHGHVAIVDDEDADLINFRWSASFTNKGGVYGKRAGKTLMHRVILERSLGKPLEPGQIADHRNGNGLDNCRSNLRVATYSQNNANTSTRRHSKTGYKGVSKISPNRWAARISIDGKQKLIGRYSSPEEAHEAYCAAAIEHFGEFARFE